MDLKPVSKPQAAAPQAPMVTPTPAPQVDPFKPDNPTPVKTGSGKSPKSHRGLKIFMVVLLVLVLLGGVGYGTFYWQHQHVDRLIAQRAELNKEIADLNTHMAEMEAENAKLTKTAATPTTDELVLKVGEVSCQAQIDPVTKKALVYTPVATGASKKKVLYSTDKSFALVYSFCEKTAHDPTQQKDAIQSYYKNVGGTWVLVANGIPLTPEQTKLYAIPSEFK